LAAGVIDTGGKFATSVTSIEENLAKDVTTDVIDTGRKFSVGINDTGCQLAAGVSDTDGSTLSFKISS
jgi:hypothetical protein